MSWVDLVLIAVLAWAGWAGWAKGLISSAFGLVSLGLGLYFAGTYYDRLAVFLERRFGFKTHLQEHLAQSAAETESAPGFAADVVHESNEIEHLPQTLDFSEAMREGLADLGLSVLAPTALDVFSFLLILIVVTGLGGGVLAKFPRIPLIGLLDRFGGFLFGLAKGFLCCLLLLIVAFVGGLWGSEWLASGLAESRSLNILLGLLYFGRM